MIEGPEVNWSISGQIFRSMPVQQVWRQHRRHPTPRRLVARLVNFSTSSSLSGTTTVTWTVGGTVDDPVSAGTVSIRMSTDGGLTFPTELLADTPNDGSAELSLTKSSSAVRLMVHSGDFTNGGSVSAFPVTAGKAMAAGFAPVNPARLLETRVGHGLKTIDGLLEGDGRLADGETIEFQVTGRGGIPASADSASLNVVAISADGPGFLTVYPCDQARPVPAASVNYDGGDVRPNAVLTKLSATGSATVSDTLRDKPDSCVVDVNGDVWILTGGYTESDANWKMIAETVRSSCRPLMGSWRAKTVDWPMVKPLSSR